MKGKGTEWVISNNIKPPRDTLIQFIVPNKDKFGEYWGQYDGIFRGYVSAEMPFPQDFKAVSAWKITELTLDKGMPKFKLAKKLAISNNKGE